jgi:hypothetical protein
MIKTKSVQQPNQTSSSSGKLLQVNATMISVSTLSYVSLPTLYSQLQRSLLVGKLRDMFVTRMETLGFKQLYLPQLTLKKPEKAQHLPILITDPALLKNKSRILVIIPTQHSGLGWLNSGQIFSEQGIESGSVLPLARALESAGSDAPGLIVANPNELYYSWKTGQSLTNREWMCLPKTSLWHPAPEITEKYNMIPENGSAEQHVRFILEKVLSNYPDIRLNAKLDIVAISDAVDLVLPYLDKNCKSFNAS